ncbi:hypothetical protein AN189_02900 [Loktanella sp. 3ANDIMAR09]|uniref:capsid cement protein n=1 Tax=Loktanella sp. 3ANDIMAR09 TaxID=1225657 RepID=UPI0006F2DBB9|nr:capsid cement protein [Loktanella sp. 3ANDIMAR09]KQI69389.1 hypothetical protein AN189_02900 [Loktanella sp. 3ANDIMAR09]
MNTPMGYVKNFTADTETPKRRIVTFGTSGGHVGLASVGTPILGVTGVRGAAEGDRVDVYMTEMQDVETGAAVAFGDYVTADADGRAIPAAPADGVQLDVLGQAMESAPSGALCPILIRPQQITG